MNDLIVERADTEDEGFLIYERNCVKMKMTKLMRRLLTMLTVVALLMSATIFMASAAAPEAEELADAHEACYAETHEHEGAAMAAMANSFVCASMYCGSWNIKSDPSVPFLPDWGYRTWNHRCRDCGHTWSTTEYY